MSTKKRFQLCPTIASKRLNWGSFVSRVSFVSYVSCAGIAPACFQGFSGTADIFRGFMVSLYVKGKENGHVQAYAPNGAMGLK